MSEFSCHTLSYLKDSKQNRGWGRIGDGNTVTKLFLEKDGVTMVLTGDEINQILKSLSSFNPSIQVR